MSCGVQARERDVQLQGLGRDPHPPTSPRPTSAVRREAASPLDSAEAYDPRLGAWALVASMSGKPPISAMRDARHRCPAPSCGGGGAGGCWRVTPPLPSGRAAGVSPRPHTAEPRAPPPPSPRSPSPRSPSPPFRKPAPRPASAVARQGPLAALVTGNRVVEPRWRPGRPHALYPLSGQWGACTCTRLAPEQPCSARAPWC